MKVRSGWLFFVSPCLDSSCGPALLPVAIILLMAFGAVRMDFPEAAVLGAVQGVIKMGSG
jgi:hypothetical protein